MTVDPLHSQHERQFAENRFVYPVLSRRSGGISVGINLNPDKVCNFDCVYCQVDRKVPSVVRRVDLERLRQEHGLRVAAVVPDPALTREELELRAPHFSQRGNIVHDLIYGAEAFHD